MGFDILIGGKNPEEKTESPADNQAEIDRQIKSDNYLMNNWNNCKFKSDKMKYMIKGCCRTEEHTGFKCNKLEILDLTPMICERCNFFEGK